MSDSSVHTSTVLTSRDEKRPSVFDVLNFSTSSDEIYAALVSQVTTDNKKVDEKLRVLSSDIALRNQDPLALNGIESTDAVTIEEFISKLLGFEDDPLLSSEDKNSLRSVIADLSQSLKNYNVEKWEQDCFATDAKIIEKALTKLTNTEYDKTLTDENRIAAQDYLKVVSMAFSYLTQIRHKLAHMNSTVDDKAEIAVKEYENVLGQIVKIPKAQIPTAAVVLTVISRINCPTAAISAIMLVCFAIGLTAVISTETITDAVDTLCKGYGIKDESLRATLSMHAKTAVVLLCTIASLGSCARMIATATARTKLATTRQALLTVAEQCSRDPAVWMKIARECLSGLFSSGITTQAFVTACTATGMQKKDAAPAAVIITAIVMLLLGEALTTTAENEDTVSAMLNNLVRKVQEKEEDPFFYARLAAEIGALRARETLPSGQALLACAQKMLPDCDFSMGHLQEDAKSMTQCMTDLIQLFANMVRGAGKLTIDLPQAG